MYIILLFTYPCSAQRQAPVVNVPEPVTMFVSDTTHGADGSIIKPVCFVIEGFVNYTIQLDTSSKVWGFYYTDINKQFISPKLIVWYDVPRVLSFIPKQRLPKPTLLQRIGDFLGFSSK